MKVQIQIATDRRRGLWAYELTRHTSKGRQTIRNAGSLAHSHAHTLAIVAMTSALRSISVNQYREMQLSTQENNPKPAINVVTLDESLADAIETATQVPTTTLRAGRNIVDVFTKQARRFDLRIEAEPDNNRLRALIQWSRQHLPDPKGILAADAVFAPRVASALV